jgi:integrase
MAEEMAMSIHRRKDSGAWEVVVRTPTRLIRKSNRQWTRADALAEEHRLTTIEHTLEEALDKWLAEYVPHLKASYKTQRQAELLRPFLKDRPIEDAPTIALEARRAWSSLKPATINRRVTILRRLCHLAFKKWGWINEPIGTRIEMLAERNERHVYLTRSQVEGLAQACALKEAGELIVFAAFTGLRWSEMLRVRSTDIINGALHVGTTKNGRPRMLPLHPRALHIAQRMPLRVTGRQLRRCWDDVREALDLQHVHWHDLRHTFASWLVQKGTPIQVVQELLGHRTISQTMRYAHLMPDNLKSAVENL